MKRRPVLGALFITATLLAACGDDDSSTGSTAAPAPVATEPAAPAETAAPDGAAAPDDDAVGTARAALDALTATPTELGATVPLAVKPTGKKIYFMQCTAPVCASMGDAIDKAGGLLGMEVTRVDLGASPDTVAKAYDRVVQDKPDGVIGTGFPPELWSDQLTKMNEAKIPYMGIGFAACDVTRDPCASGSPPPITVSVFGRPDVELYGKLMADYVIADSKADANAVFFHIPDFNLHVPELAAFKDEMAALCPTCGVADVPAQVLDIGQALPQAVVGYVQANPDTNYVVMAFGDMAIGVPEALKTAGLDGKVKIVSMASGAAGFNYMKNGQGQVVDFGYPNGFAGWLAVDGIARVLGGQKPSANPLPRQMIEGDDLTFDVNADWPGVADYEAQFKALWGV